MCLLYDRGILSPVFQCFNIKFEICFRKHLIDLFVNLRMSLSHAKMFYNTTLRRREIRRLSDTFDHRDLRTGPLGSRRVTFIPT